MVYREISAKNFYSSGLSMQHLLWN